MITTVGTENFVLSLLWRGLYDACANLKAFESRQPKFMLRLAMHGTENRSLLPTCPPYPIPSHHLQELNTTLL
jgi:hypothetical protein